MAVKHGLVINFINSNINFNYTFITITRYYLHILGTTTIPFTISIYKFNKSKHTMNLKRNYYPLSNLIARKIFEVQTTNLE